MARSPCLLPPLPWQGETHPKLTETRGKPEANPRLPTSGLLPAGTSPPAWLAGRRKKKERERERKKKKKKKKKRGCHEGARSGGERSESRREGLLSEEESRREGVCLDLHRLVWAVPGLEPGIPCNFEFNLRFTPPREESGALFSQSRYVGPLRHTAGRSRLPPAGPH